MLNTILSKRAKALALILILSVFLTAATALETTKHVKAKRGGAINIAQGVKLVVSPRALEEDTVISASMVRERDRICFYFGPDGTKFSKPAKLCISWRVINNGDVKDLTLYGPDDSEIEPEIRPWGAKYPIPHFSLYYYRRR